MSIYVYNTWPGTKQAQYIYIYTYFLYHICNPYEPETFNLADFIQSHINWMTASRQIQTKSWALDLPPTQDASGKWRFIEGFATTRCKLSCWWLLGGRWSQVRDTSPFSYIYIYLYLYTYIYIYIFFFIFRNVVQPLQQHLTNLSNVKARMARPAQSRRWPRTW